MSDISQRAALAERASRAGGAVARDAFRSAVRVETKADKNDLVTEADHQSQRQVVHTITQEFPGEALVCEESPGDGDEQPGPGGEVPPHERAGEFLDAVPESGPCWVVDPIDGTANFARGLRLWCTAIGVVRDGETVAAATYLPAVQDAYTVGEGSVTRNGNTVTVSERTDPETFAAALVARWPREHSERLGEVTASVRAATGDLRRFGSLQATLAFVASGELEAAVTTEPMTPWDTLAGVELVRAAGGTVTDVHGDRWTLGSEGMVATNGEAHDAVREAVADGLAAE